MIKDTTYLLTTRGWSKSKEFKGFLTPYVFVPVVMLTTEERLEYCVVEFSY